MQKWALILGASSGFGGAISRRLAAEGYGIFGVHLDRKRNMPNVEAIISDIEAAGSPAVFFNINAADTRARKEVIKTIEDRFREEEGTIQVFVHSLAFGTLLPVVHNPNPGGVVHKAQMDMTLDVMAHSLVYWTQELVDGGLLGQGGRIFAMTSSGDARVIPSYGPVSAAKAALEAHIRPLAVEPAPIGAPANRVRAGVPDPPAPRTNPARKSAG